MISTRKNSHIVLKSPLAQRDFLTAEQLAELLGVCENTIQSWIDDGLLESGEDFVGIKRVRRFITEATIQKLLHRSSAEPAATPDDAGSKRQPKRTVRPRPTTSSRRSRGINLDY